MDSIIIFIKNPELGKVKTRLAKGVGDAMALQVYTELLEITRAKVCQLTADKYLYYSSFLDTSDGWSGIDFIKMVQSAGNLGTKMANAFQEVLSNKPLDKSPHKVLIIGSDCAALSVEIMQNAFQQLDAADIVIGPTHDGGYYLLGMKVFYHQLFQNIQWSTESVFRETIDIANQLGLTYQSLPMLHDIDTKEDWEHELSKRLAE